MTEENRLFIVGASLIGLLIGFLVAYFTNKSKLDNANAQLAVLNSNLEAEQTAKLKAEQQLSDTNGTLQTLRVEQAQEQTHKEALTKENERLSQSYSEAMGKVEQLTKDVGLTKEQLSATSAKLAAEEEKSNKLSTSLTSLEATQKDLRSELQAEKDNSAALDKKAKGFEVEGSELSKQIAEQKQHTMTLQQKHEQLQEHYNTQSTAHAELKTSLEERDNSHQQKVAQLEESKQALTKEFENLANKIFEEKGKTFTDTSKSSIDVMLKPFREQIEGFQKRINDVHDASLKGNTHLNAEIKKVLDIGLKMSTEATNLTSALKGDSQKRGAWGEAQLERTLEMSGLMPDAHFEKQSAFKDAEGKSKQTDFLIKLPGDKHIIIDSKVELVAYDRAVSADSDAAYNQAMDEHAKAVKAHIDDLIKKDYTNLIGLRSPSFVLMFMPIEPAYIEALKHNKDLFNYGCDKDIVLVSHTTLLPILRTVANLWVMEQSNKAVREISDSAGLIYNNVVTLAEKLNKLGNTLISASNHYNDTVKSLVGKQGLYGKVERFTQLSSKVNKTMPALEAKHMDFETEKLMLIAEPIEEAREEAKEEIGEDASESPVLESLKAQEQPNH